MSRALGTYTISFGLVAIPVKVYSATESQNSVSFNMLHKTCHSRLKQQYLCSAEGCVVTREETVKGYEFAKDKYIAIDPDELKNLEEKATHTIDITETIPVNKLDPLFFDQPYFLGPNKGGARGYGLLFEALKRSNQCALATYVSRGREHLAAIIPIAGGLLLQNLLFKNEVRSIKDIPLDPVEAKEAEINLAMQLVNSLAVPDFDPTKYRDGFQDRVMALINAKVEGKVPVDVPCQISASPLDIMEALKKSLAKKQ